MANVVVEFSRDVETKNKVRYSNTDFGTIYVPKHIAEELGQPEKLKVTLAGA